MNELMIKYLAGIMGIKPEEFKAELEKTDGDDTIVKTFFDGKQIWTAEKHAEVIKNAKKDGVNELMVKGAEIPEAVYNAVKKTALSKIEKKYSEQYEIEEFSSTDDLVSKIIEKRSKVKDGDKLSEENILLKQKLRDEMTAKAAAIEEEKGKRLKYIANSYLDASINDLPINAEGDALKVNRKIARSMFLEQHKLNVTEDEDGTPTIQVIGKDGNVMKDDVLNPVSVYSALETFASEGYVPLKQPDGRGGKSSDTTLGDNPLKGLPENELASYIQEKGFSPMSKESQEVIKDWEKTNGKEF